MPIMAIPDVEILAAGLLAIVFIYLPDGTNV